MLARPEPSSAFIMAPVAAAHLALLAPLALAPLAPEAAALARADGVLMALMAARQRLGLRGPLAQADVRTRGQADLLASCGRAL